MWLVMLATLYGLLSGAGLVGLMGRATAWMGGVWHDRGFHREHGRVFLWVYGRRCRWCRPAVGLPEARTIER